MSAPKDRNMRKVTQANSYACCQECGQDVRLIELHGKVQLARHKDLRGIRKNASAYAYRKAPDCPCSKWLESTRNVRLEPYATLK